MKELLAHLHALESETDAAQERQSRVQEILLSAKSDIREGAVRIAALKEKYVDVIGTDEESAVILELADTERLTKEARAREAAAVQAISKLGTTNRLDREVVQTISMVFRKAAEMELALLPEGARETICRAFAYATQGGGGGDFGQWAELVFDSRAIDFRGLTAAKSQELGL